MSDMLPSDSERKPSLRVLFRYWFRRLIPPLSVERRATVQVQLRDASTPDFDFFLLVCLSSVIATFGLITDSAAVIIGAMLVAPLMSPILGVSLASIAGDQQLFRHAISALIRGMLLAVGMAFILTWSSQILPFNPIIELPAEVLARTRPSPFDLGIAIAGGIAAAFALAQPELSAALPGVAIATALMPPLCTLGIGLALGSWRIAGGAGLLYLTNLAAIAFAGVLTFFALGFRPQGIPRNHHKIPQSLRVSAALVGLLVIPLAYISATFFSQGRQETQIRNLVDRALTERDCDLVSVIRYGDRESLHLEITARSSHSTAYQDVVQLRDDLATALREADIPFTEFSIGLTVIPSSRLDPLVPPTFTPTSTAGPTPTPTVTATITQTPTTLPSLTPTLPPTPTLTPTPTPAILLVSNTQGLGLKMRASPFGPEIARLREGSLLWGLPGYHIEGGLVWIEVRDAEGRIGWVPQYYTLIITPTATVAPSPSPSATENGK